MESIMESLMPCKHKVIEKICVILKNPRTPKIKNNLYRKENGKIVGTCALGEIGLQLNITDLNIFKIIDVLVKIGIPKQLVDDDYGNADLHDSILEWNDETNLTKPQIAEEIRKKFGDVQ